MTTENSADLILDFSHHGATGRVFCARTSGLYYSEDAGRTWLSSFRALENSNSPVTTAVLAERDYIFAAIPGGVLVSPDAGENWQLTELGFPAPTISRIKASPQFEIDGIAIACSLQDGVFRTEDFGETWLPWNIGLIDQRISDVEFSPAFVEDRAVYVISESMLYKSINKGRSWEYVSSWQGNSQLLWLGFILENQDGSSLVVGTEADGLFCSADLQKWDLLGLVGHQILAVYTDPTKNGMIVVTNERVFRMETTDTWQEAHRETGVEGIEISASLLFEKENGRFDLWLGNFQGQIEVIKLLERN